MALVWELLEVLLAAFGLVCLGWLAFGRLVLPVGQDGTETTAILSARGGGNGLEQAVSGLLWLRRTGLWTGRIVIADRGLDPGGLALARRLAQRGGVELRAAGTEPERDGERQ